MCPKKFGKRANDNSIILASFIYFMSGKNGEGIFLASAITIGTLFF